MTPVHSTSQERLGTGWLGAREAAQVPERVRGAAPAGPAVADDASRARGWPRTLLRRVRDVAIGLALIVNVPMAVVATRGDVVWMGNIGTAERLAGAERYRSLRAPVDPSITPQQAGLAMRALMTSKSDPHFPMIGANSSAERPWMTRELTPDMFAKIRGTWFKGPAPQAVVTLAVAGFSEPEMNYLRAVAESPVWRDFDAVAHAGRIDVIGGRYVLPFREDAFAPAMTSLAFADTKSLASAGVLRAAYYLANGQRDLAEGALRSVMSFGFAMIDNGTSTLDALIGRLIVDIGRDGLYQFYQATGDGNLADLTAPVAKSAATAARGRRTFESAAAARARLLADAQNPEVPRAVRFESLNQLAFGSCSSVSGMLRGPSADVLAVFDDAKHTLARYPSEQAYLDLLLHSVDRMPDDFVSRRSASQMLLEGPGAVASIVLRNPRIAACTRIVSAY